MDFLPLPRFPPGVGAGPALQSKTSAYCHWLPPTSQSPVPYCLRKRIQGSFRLVLRPPRVLLRYPWPAPRSSQDPACSPSCLFLVANPEMRFRSCCSRPRSLRASASPVLGPLPERALAAAPPKAAGWTQLHRTERLVEEISAGPIQPGAPDVESAFGITVPLYSPDPELANVTHQFLDACSQAADPSHYLTSMLVAPLFHPFHCEQNRQPILPESNPPSDLPTQLCSPLTPDG